MSLIVGLKCSGYDALCVACLFQKQYMCVCVGTKSFKHKPLKRLQMILGRYPCHSDKTYVEPAKSCVRLYQQLSKVHNCTGKHYHGSYNTALYITL